MDHGVEFKGGARRPVGGWSREWVNFPISSIRIKRIAE
jgi:hypothetical protein